MKCRLWNKRIQNRILSHRETKRPKQNIIRQSWVKEKTELMKNRLLRNSIHIKKNICNKNGLE